ncbi:FUSC family protein [Kitasatospora sp. NA04385]|uniref:FUSC family protein n=1 Tax=Kitasatospora sp. NA04385 TaxID=2742135 RepID=UPI0015928F23|nr:FUSC family protein [Kitasatospora sp. NA04385]QKW23805.1 FUSC family protein [Kitasatospora sp. NA04385]
MQQAVPALAGALGLLIGAATGWWAVPLLGAVGVLCGAISVTGPVASAAAVQLMVLTVLGCGMPVPLPGWAKAACYLAGAGWLLLLRQLTTHPRPLHAERQAVAAVFDALADALDAAGTDRAEPARRRLTAALDRAGEQLRTGHDRTLGTRLAAASALCEAGVALLRDARPLPARLATGPRRLAAAVRADRLPGPLPVPVAETPRPPPSTGPSCTRPWPSGTPPATGRSGPGGQPRPGRGARARARPAAEAGRMGAGRAGRAAARPGSAVPGLRPWGRAGRAYGVRVGVCVAASAALALGLRTGHWYWLPVTAAFLVKPDLGPLFSRVVNRFAGTVAGVLLVAALAPALPGPWWPVGAVAATGALIPVAQRHFAAQTAVITVTVLAFVTTGGDHGAAPGRLADTTLACALVLLVGHLPGLADTRARVGQRAAHALRHTQRYLDHVLLTDRQSAPGTVAARRAELRRTAYRTLAQARAAAENAAAELHPGGPAGPDWLRLTVHAERLADAATAYAVERDHGAPAPAAPAARTLTRTLAAAADALDRPGPPTTPPATDTPLPPELDGVAAEVHRIGALAAG